MSNLANAPRRTSVAIDIESLLKMVDRVRAEAIPAIHELISKLEGADAAEAELHFGGLIGASQVLLDLDDTDMARLLNVSRPTIGRWIRGVASPYPLTRKAIANALIKKARSRIRLLEA